MSSQAGQSTLCLQQSMLDADCKAEAHLCSVLARGLCGAGGKGGRGRRRGGIHELVQAASGGEVIHVLAAGQALLSRKGQAGLAGRSAQSLQRGQLAQDLLRACNRESAGELLTIE